MGTFLRASLMYMCKVFVKRQEGKVSFISGSSMETQGNSVFSRKTLKRYLRYQISLQDRYSARQQSPSRTGSIQNANFWYSPGGTCVKKSPILLRTDENYSSLPRNMYSRKFEQKNQLQGSCLMISNCSQMENSYCSLAKFYGLMAMTSKLGNWNIFCAFYSITKFYNQAYYYFLIFLQGAHPILKSQLIQSLISFWMLQQVYKFEAISMIFITLQQTVKVVSTSSGYIMLHNLLIVSILQLPSTLQMTNFLRLFTEQYSGLLRETVLKVMRYLVEPKISDFFRSILTNLLLISLRKAVPGHFSSACMVKNIQQAISATMPGALLRTFTQQMSSLRTSSQAQPQQVMRLEMKKRKAVRRSYPLVLYRIAWIIPFKLSIICNHSFFFTWQFEERTQSRKQQQAQAAILDSFIEGGQER